MAPGDTAVRTRRRRGPEVGDEEARPRAPATAGRRSRRRRPAHRFRVVYDINGPRVRLGVLWFVLNVTALVVGLEMLGPLYAVVAAVAALQSAAAWRRRKRHPNRLVAGLGAGLLPLAAAVSTALLGLALLVLAAAAFGAAVAARRAPPLVDAGATLQCSLFVGLAAASLVVTHRFEIGAAVTLVLLVAAYETGDYLVGSGASNPIEGPLAGTAAIVIVAFAVSQLSVPPFGFPSAFVFGAMAAVLCPVGQLAASAVLPAADSRADALRRLDSLLVLGPIWAWSVGLYIG